MSHQSRVNKDHEYMARAIQLAKKGWFTTHPNPRVGCVIVKNDEVVGEGYHQRAGEPHAEINALDSLQSLQKLSAKKLAKGATAYVTLEPCSHTGKTPPCANALIDAEVSRVIIAMQDPNPQVAGQGIQRLRDAGIEVVVGVLEIEARALNSGFIKRMEQGLPWVRVKLGMSLDGRTAMSSGESQWITGSDARADVQRLRASADAILTGSGTVLADNPSLNVRATAAELGLDAGNNDKGLEVRQPLRVVLDSALKISPKSKMLSLEGETVIYTCSDEAKNQQALEQSGAKVIQIKSDELGRVPLKPVLQDLAKQQINEVHVEAGATLCGALLQQQLVDEIILYMAPTIMGADARGLFNVPELDKMKDKIDLTIQDIRAVGNDWRIRILLNA